MKISVRMTIAFLVAALLPLIIVGVWSILTLRQASQLAIESGETALTALGQNLIQGRAEAVARQIEIYLDGHPEVDWHNTAQLEANAELAAIAVQHYGEKGYTAVFDQEAVTHFHPSASIIGRDLRIIMSQYPDFLRIINASLAGEAQAGYYDWPDDPADPNSPVRPKYMSVVPVAGTPLRVASTTYIEEFSRPVAEVEARLGKIRNRAYGQLFAVLLGVALVTCAGAYFLGQRYSRPISQMVEAATRIADGDLAVEPPVSDLGELGQLSAAFRRMTDNLSSLIRRVQSMSVGLTSAAEQVMMTHRYHTVHSDEQAAAVANSSTAVEELASSSAHIADMAQQVVAAASQTQANAQQGVQTMHETAKWLQSSAAFNQETVAKIRTLGTVAREIGAVMDLIEDIAAQTRMIAFNASIEASAAGAVGRRFAVVAGEVRRLASDVAQSAEEIRGKIEQIQTMTDELIVASDLGWQMVEAGQSLSLTMAEVLDQIHANAQQTTQAVQQISLGTRQQRSATEQLLSDLQSLAAGAQAVAASSKQTVAVMDDLVTLAQDVNLAIERFRLPGAVRNQIETMPILIEAGRGEGQAADEG